MLDSGEHLSTLKETPVPFGFDTSGREVIATNPTILLMSKNKNLSLFTRIMKKMQYSSKSLLALAAFIVLSCLGVFYLGNFKSSSGSQIFSYSQDRSLNFKVKVLPLSADDEALNLLPKDSFSYLAMIDAGSSGCRAHIYRYGKLGTIEGPLYVLPQHVSKKVKPGLSTFARNPADAGSSLVDLVAFIKEQVPEADWSVTPIWLKATAGLRMLNKAESDAIISSISSFLSDNSKSPFVFRPSWARIIPGNEEGGFGWIAYNYLKRVIGPKRVSDTASPYAVIEMGGASAQVSQLASSPAEIAQIPPENRFAFDIEGKLYTLYTHSYLGYGAEQARESLNRALIASLASGNVINDPCLNPGFDRSESSSRKEVYEGPDGSYNVRGISDAKGSCSKALGALFVKSKDTDQKCSTAGPHSFGCVYQPDFLLKSENILVFENFYYVSSGIGVLPANHEKSPATTSAVSFPLLTSPKEIEESAQEVCSKTWDTVQAEYPKDKQPKDVAIKLCFSSSFATSFLVDGLGLKSDAAITIQKDVGSSEIEWALGAAFKEVSDFLKRSNLRQGN